MSGGVVTVTPNPLGPTDWYQRFQVARTAADDEDAAEIFIPEGTYLIEMPQNEFFLLDLVQNIFPDLRRIRGAGSEKTKLVIGWRPPPVGDLAEGTQIPGLFRFIDMPDESVEGLSSDVRNLNATPGTGSTAGDDKMYTQGTIVSATGSIIKFKPDPGFVPEFFSTDYTMGIDRAGAVIGWNYPSSETDSNGTPVAYEVLKGTDHATTGLAPTVATFWHGRVSPAAGETIVIGTRRYHPRKFFNAPIRNQLSYTRLCCHPVVAL